ncbi:MAG: GYDIA family GHMP kinase [Bacteroidota bacterium]
MTATPNDPEQGLVKQEFYSNGKLLLTGEYVVLDGAFALAVPTRYGQSLVVEPTSSGKLQWASLNDKGDCWFTVIFSSELIVLETTDKTVAKTLFNILHTANAIQPNFLKKIAGYQVTTQMDFPNEWGLGSSSTLINNIAQWAQCDPFELLERSFGGSGYDIAAAQSQTPLLYQRSEMGPEIKSIALDWDFTDQLFFVHLNKKQDSKLGIERYRAMSNRRSSTLERISELSQEVANCVSLDQLRTLLTEHEQRIAQLLDMPTVKETRFPDYPGLVKSLGAWGGDFVLASGDAAAMDYFREKGYHTVIPWAKMLL